LEPINTETLEFIQGLTSQQLGSKVVFIRKSNFGFRKINIAVLVLDNRGAGKGADVVDLSAIRESYMFPGNWDASIADLGTILGEFYRRLLFCFAKSSFEFNKKKIIPIVIGGSQDLTFALYRSFDELEQMVNLVSR
jgi:hypothetical protein